MNVYKNINHFFKNFKFKNENNKIKTKMSSYILISSSYRDRLLYPEPSDFIVPFQTINSQVLNLSVINTKNPITQYPLYNFCWTNFKYNSFIYKTKIVGGNNDIIFLDKQIYSDLLGLSDPYLYQSIENCENILTNYSISINGQKTYILYFSITYCKIKIQDPIHFNIGDDIFIENIQLSENFNNNEYIIINGKFESQFLKDDNDFIIYNMNLNEKRKCSYISNINSVRLVEKFSLEQQPTDKYIIYSNDNTLINGEIVPIFESSQSYFLNDALLDYDFIDYGKNYILNELVILKSNIYEHENNIDYTIYKIKNISITNNMELELYQLGTQSFHRSNYYYIFPINSLNRESFQYAKIFITRVSNIFRFRQKLENNNDRFLKPDDFIGNYFQCLLLSPIFKEINNHLYLTPNFTMPVINKSSKQLTLQENQELNGVFPIIFARYLKNSNDILLYIEKISPLLLNRFNILNYNLNTFPIEFTGCFNTLIYKFIKEGVVPLNFTGSYLTQSQMSCYELSLLCLILPNAPIKAVNSLLTSGYPYVLFEISNATLPSGHNKNSIITNNPNAINSTFVCSISDINDPIKTKFIKINADKAIQHLKFSPADNLHIRILLPNGKPFLLATNDYLPPSIPNPLLQIECLIQIKKI